MQSNNNIQNNGISFLGRGLNSCRNLRQITLNLWQNCIDDDGIARFGYDIGNFESLTALNIYLWKNQIGDQGILHFGQGISKSRTIKNLLINCWSNKIGVLGAQGFLKQLQNCENLNSLILDLQNNNIRNQENYKLMKNIYKIKRLTSCLDSKKMITSSFEARDKNLNNLCKQQINSSYESNNSNFKICADLIMKLVSNKSNFCSDQFLNELNQNLQKVNPLFQNKTIFNTIYKENKEPLDFSKISQEKLKYIQEYVEHQIFLTSDLQYEEQQKNSLEIKQIKEMLSLFYHNLQFCCGAKYNNGLENCLANKNENGEIQIEKIIANNEINCISKMSLQKNLKYIFRVQVKSINEGNYFLIGLVRSSNSEST
ncbi:hypothetical protein ABPG73_017094 [Tetrahymena malaccensis]